jgi:hypothetical protein
VVTFDDGYHDFADYAFPVLQELNIAVTLFVTTGFADGELWLWPDQIRYALDNTRISEIEIPGIAERLNVAQQPERCWHHIADYCMTLSNTEKLSLIDELYKHVRIERPAQAPEEYRPLTWQQIRKMVDQGLDIGSHSYSHPILTKLNDNELRRELTTSRDSIRKQLNIESSAFCYPNGQKIDFDERVQAGVYEAGYDFAVAAFSMKNPLSDRWAIGRYPGTSNMSSFEKVIHGFSFLGKY